MEELIRQLKAKGVLRTKAIEAALRAVDRANFVPGDLRPLAYRDEALSTAFGQTISQPYTVVFMLEHLGAKPGDQIMDIGSGSGWSSALLAHLVGDQGLIQAIEVRGELCQFGKSNLVKYPELNSRVNFYCQNAIFGLSEVARKIGGFDRIICAAAVDEVPEAWREQLKLGGRLLYPREYALMIEDKITLTDWQKTEYPGFIFVPFVE